MQLSRIYALAGLVPITLIVVLAIVLLFSGSGSGSDFFEIPIGDSNQCTEYLPFAKLPTSLMIGPCEKNDAGHCRLKPSTEGLEIKATFMPEGKQMAIGPSVPVTLEWSGDEVASGEACQAGFTCPDYEGKKAQSLDWKPYIFDMKAATGFLTLKVAGLEKRVIYCVRFPVEVVA